ncbi:hypothetical protein LV476_04815 [Guyparkeria hydrothermalis]|uniref:hypothetical protein n=1 Tax=Guyparkeria hydrothermalis TaxID=923 RepID=UPI0020200894|nr:hypothetical protein [Guyparkeria hydrothermalis]MCL7744273.1 hypothetical protein [Guyparkeria hydrothermalis]
MSKKKKTGFPKDLWVIEGVDRMNWDDDFRVAGPMPREEAHAEYDRLTENGTTKTAQDKSALSYYVMRQVG